MEEVVFFLLIVMTGESMCQEYTPMIFLHKKEYFVFW